MGIIYRAKNTLNGMSYIGATSDTLIRRKHNHLSEARLGKGSLFQRDLNQFSSHFEWSIIFDQVSEDELDELEKESIEVYQTLYPKGYNLTTGGKKNSECTLEARRLMSIPKSEETKLRMSASAKSRITNNRSGTTHSLQSRTKISESLRGHQVSNETREKMRLSALNRKRKLN